MANSESTFTLKLLIDAKANKVLFAEASEDFVDFLFFLFSLPVGDIIRIDGKEGMEGDLAKLYESFENLIVTYMQPNVNKDSIFKPKPAIGDTDALRLLSKDISMTKTVYTCGSYHRYFSDDPRAICPDCKYTFLSTELFYVAPRPAEGGSSGDGLGYEKGVVTYMVMDDLKVKPMSTISSITILKKFKVKEVGSLEEKVVSLGTQEGISLFKAGLQTTSVLTRVFLGRKPTLAFDCSTQVKIIKV